MRIATFGAVRSEQPAIIAEDGGIVPLNPLLRDLGFAELGTNEFLALLDYLQPIVEAALPRARVKLPAGSVRIGPPVPKPEKIIVAGGNYQSHVDEAMHMKNAPSPSVPILVFKPSNTVIGPNDDLVRPRISEQFDYETEIGVVIGRGGFEIKREDAFDHVAGYMITNDVTARDLAMFEDTKISPIYAQMTRAKGIQTGAPCGPWIATKDEIPDPHNLHLQCWVNGKLAQDGWSSEMIVDIPGLIEEFSKVVELSPGDFIMTGTTTGCGAFQDPPRFLTAGDVVRMQIDGLGATETPIVDAPGAFR
jgi:2-keto-4-pentenoate hydratase/2-oxohepta-3-ene-1,7-dioic acid hydratase in catechol pathway